MHSKDYKHQGLLAELHYLPNLEFFVAILEAEVIEIEIQGNFTKQTYRNRCYIKGANKTEILSIPVKKGARRFKDVQIDYKQGWLKDHWRTITSAYGKSPFFEYYRDGFESIFFKKENFLYDLNLQLLTKCLDFLGIEKEIKFTDTYGITPNKGVFDFRDAVFPHQPYSVRNIYKSFPYQQIFGKGFVGNLSVLDLLCCEGPGSKVILNQSKAASEEQL